MAASIDHHPMAVRVCRALALLTATCAGAAAADSALAQQHCVDPPLFSGNVVVTMPPRPDLPVAPLIATSRVAGDFNGDGHADLLFGTARGSLVFFAGTGNGWGFQPPVITALSFAQTSPVSRIVALATADLDGDGKLDLAAGTEYSGTVPPQRVHVMRGNGNGSFQPGVPVGPALEEVLSIVIADFNNNGALDLMCAMSQPAALLAWGAGNGTFPTFTSVACGGDTLRVEAADINNDGAMDALLELDTSPPQAILLMNDGAGGFTVVQPVALQGPHGATFGSLNGDNWPDIVMATLGDAVTPGAAWVALNDGAGAYPSRVPYAITTVPNQLWSGSNPFCVDVTGDGLDEVVIARRNECNAISKHDQIAVLRNLGSGVLSTPPSVLHHAGGLSAGSALWFVASDFNGDGVRDLVAAAQSRSTVLLNPGDGAFMTNHGVPMGQSVQGGDCNSVPLATFKHLATGDFNNDGRFDLVAIREPGGGSPVPLDCVVMLQDAQGSFTDIRTTPLPENTNQGLVVADFDRDGNLDVAVCSQDTALPSGGDSVRVALGDGEGSFAPWTLYHTVGKHPRGIATADLNGDLWPDLVVPTAYGADYPIKPQGPRGFSVFLNDGTGSLALPVQYEVGDRADGTAVADLNQDGFPDVAISCGVNGTAGVRVFLNNGGGVFSPVPGSYVPSPVGVSRMTLADVTGDGAPDLLAALNYDGANPTSGGLVVARNSGGGIFTFLAHLDALSDYSVERVACADLNGDMLADIAINDGFRATLNIHLNQGNGVFGARIAYSGGESAIIGGESVIVADFDGDGRSDLGVPMGSSPDWDLGTHGGFSILRNRMCAACYPDCNGSETLTIADFACFQTKFVLQEPYADCNGGGTLTIADFACFQTKFVQGCP